MVLRTDFTTFWRHEITEDFVPEKMEKQITLNILEDIDKDFEITDNMLIGMRKLIK